MTETGGCLTICVQHVAHREGDKSTDVQLAPGRYVKIGVTDTGSGIDPAIRDRIFEPFYTTREVGKGTGLGLPVVHGIVTRRGGDIAVESTGQGSSFLVYLPQPADNQPL